ncbi:TPA: type II toxin-antitoxin system HicB family antitoxin [Haemophilus influenzae]
MSKVLEYKNFIGSVKFSLEDNLLFGKILHVNGLVTYEGATLDELREEFKLAVDDYIEYCQENGIDAHKSYDGKFNVRIPSELHKKAAIQSIKQGVSLNAFVSQAIQNEILSKEREISTVYEFMQKTIETTIQQNNKSIDIGISKKYQAVDFQYQSTSRTN